MFVKGQKNLTAYEVLENSQSGEDPTCILYILDTLNVELLSSGLVYCRNAVGPDELDTFERYELGLLIGKLMIACPLCSHALCIVFVDIHVCYCGQIEKVNFSVIPA